LKAATLLFSLLLLSSSAWAQKAITGTVTDAQTGETLPSTNILIEDTYRGTITNENGVYSLSIPDSLLPATLVVRYIGFQSQSRAITESSSRRQDFALEPSVTEMEEIVVTDEDPGVRIMREVIRRKQEWRQKLSTYHADAYTRQTLANDTSIVSITESVSEVFWDKEQGHREVLKSKRQTANIEASSNFAGVSYLPNFYDDNIEIAGFNLVGVTHPKALDYYDFKLIDQTSLDGQPVYKIKVSPARKLQPLFEGTVFVLDEEYALLEVDLQPNDVVTFPKPVQSFTTSYRQQFNNFGKEFWLPVDARIGGDVKIKMIGLDFPLIKFKQISRITNYRVNVELPDSLYKKEDTFSVDSTTVNSDSLIAREINTIPLSADEERAYATVDSTATLEKAFKPSGFLARFVDDDDESDDGSQTFGFLNKIPGNLSPELRYNRVDEVFGGLNYSIDATEWLELRGNGGYSTGYDSWGYGGGLSVRWLDRNNIRANLGFDYTSETARQYDSKIYKSWYTIIPNLLGNHGYFDYYRSEGFQILSEWELPRQDLSLKLGFNSYDQSSLSTNTAYDLLGEDNYRTNPLIDEGRLNSVELTAGYSLGDGYNFGVTGQKYLEFSVEHSAGALGSDFDFSRYQTELNWTFPTFYQRRLLANTLDINIKGGTYSGSLPWQKTGIVDVALGETAPWGALKAARNYPYRGKQYLAVNMEHNFRTIPFEAIGLTPLVEQNIGLIVFGGAAKTWGLDIDSQQLAQRNYIPNTTQGIHWEAGVSLNGILGLFRVDFASRLDQPAFLVNIGVARIF